MATTKSARKRAGRLPAKKGHVIKGPSEKIRSLAAISLAGKIGYLKLSDLLGPNESKLVSAIENLSSRSFKQGAAIQVKQKEPTLLIVKSGAVNIFRRTPTGDKVPIKKLGAGYIFGEAPSLGQTMLGAEAEAAEKTELVYLKESDLERMAEESPQLALRLLRQVGSKLVEAERRHEQSAFQTIPIRLAGLFLEQADENGVVAGLTHQQIAERLGVYRETVTNGIADLKRAGLIKVGRKKVFIINKEGLQAVASSL
jgi:CRP/FNR family cyclic AMP-dependent transcriptional regulator